MLQIDLWLWSPVPRAVSVSSSPVNVHGAGSIWSSQPIATLATRSKSFRIRCPRRSCTGGPATPEASTSCTRAWPGVPSTRCSPNAGHGLGRGFLDQSFDEILHVIDTNITGTLALIHKVGNDMRSRGVGRILITGSIAGFMPGTFQAVYNGTKAFIDSFSWALRNELKDTGVTVTCLMPAPLKPSSSSVPT